MMEALKAAATIILGLAIMAALVFVAALLLIGAAKVSVWALPAMTIATMIGVAICVVILLPLSIFRFSRPLAAWGFFIASYVFGVTAWMCGFLVTLDLWGVWGLLVGLFLGLVGVVPLGLLAAVFHGVWSVVIGLAILLVMTYGSRFFGFYLAHTLDRAALRDRPLIAG